MEHAGQGCFHATDEGAHWTADNRKGARAGARGQRRAGRGSSKSSTSRDLPVQKYGLGQFYKDPTREEVIVDGAYFRAFYHTDPPNDFWRSLNVQWPTDNALHLTTCSLYVDGEAPLDCYFLGMRRGKPVHILITTEDVDGMRVRLPCDQRTARRLFDAGRRHEPDNVPADSWELFAVAAEALSRAFA